MNNVIKIKKEDLFDQKVGNYLYEENGELYFCSKPSSAMFELKRDYKNYDETLNHHMNFDDYVQKFLEICAKIENKPSLIFLNYVPKNVMILNGTEGNYKTNYSFLTNLTSDEDFETLNTKPSIICEPIGVMEILRQLVETRSENEPQTDVFVFFNEPEKYCNLDECPGIDSILTACKNRRIYLVFNFVNSYKFIERYGIESYELIENYCSVKFICNYNGVVDIQPTNKVD